MGSTLQDSGNYSVCVYIGNRKRSSVTGAEGTNGQGGVNPGPSRRRKTASLASDDGG